MAIELRNLSKSFDGKTVLQALNHSFPDGRITCITGPSGCGKTTLLNLILGLLPADQGEICGLPQGRIPTVFQEERLIEHLTALGNLRAVLGRWYPVEEMLAALQAVGLGDAAHNPVHILSGGMRRRVALVRALLAEGELVILDEPFKGLDGDTRELAVCFARQRLRGRTALLVTHDPAEIAMLDAEVFRME